MISNLEKYKNDLEKLLSDGENLLLAMIYESSQKEFEKQCKPIYKKDYTDLIKKLPSFINTYQSWYSEALIILKQLLPDRVPDFVKLYEKPKNRKSVSCVNYVIEDYLQTLIVKNGFGDIKVGPEAAIIQFQQQFYIIKSIEKRFESSLFDIKQLFQADIFDSELEAAKELTKKGFMRAAGAISGVVLERHLAQVCANHHITISKKKTSISDCNDKLKDTEVYETPTWRKIQHLCDLRNLCDHNKKNEPKIDDVDELIEGVEKIIKTIF